MLYKNVAVHALTAAHYRGYTRENPSMEYEEKGLFPPPHTPTPGSNDSQFRPDRTGTRLFEQVLETAQKWGSPENLMFVVGATQGAMFAEVRRVAPQSFLLVPGVGAQGGSLEEVAKWGMTHECGLLVNSSRGIIYASNGEDFAEAAAAEARKLRDHMTILLSTYGVI